MRSSLSKAVIMSVSMNFICRQVEATFSTSIVCPNHYSQYYISVNANRIC